MRFKWFFVSPVVFGLLCLFLSIQNADAGLIVVSLVLYIFWYVFYILPNLRKIATDKLKEGIDGSA